MPKERAFPVGLSESPSAGFGGPFVVPDATVTRLPVYLRTLNELAERGVETVSSEELARQAGVTSAKLRKDLSYLGSYGTRGVGYDVGHLVTRIAEGFGLAGGWRVAIVGVGNLGRALAGYRGFAEKGFTIVALLDSAPELRGVTIGGLPVEDAASLEEVLARTRASIGVIATPAEAAQQICDRLVAAGIRSILNFAPTVLHVPDTVRLRKVDVASELQILAFHATRTNRIPAAGRPTGAEATR